MIEITTELVKNLIKEQFPQWANLPIKPVAKSGNDNRTFHLGNEMTVRLPYAECYAAQVEKEMKWLPKLKPFLALPISSPIANGKASLGYPFPWSVNLYLQGENASHEGIIDMNKFASDLGMFLKDLQSIDAKDAPLSGLHNFFRGGDLSIYHQETEKALEDLNNVLPTEKLDILWKKAISSKWENDNVWVHGDIAPGNLLVKDGSLCGVIDFGVMCVGDPSCDYAIAWTFFDARSRKVFFETLGCDKATIDRAIGWALWKALITYNAENVDISKNARQTINSILDDVSPCT